MRIRVVVTIALALAAGACGSGDEPGAETRRAQESPGATPTPTETADTASRGVELKRIGNFDEPLQVTAPEGERRDIYVVEKGGRIVRLAGSDKTVFLDISDQVSKGYEQGLLGLAFAPDYADSGLFYVNFTNRSGDTRIVEYRRGEDGKADPSSARVVLRQPQPEANHNGGQLAFGPDDMLYIGLGDGGGGGDQHGEFGNAQDLSSLLGKILRIDPTSDGRRPYSIPDDNPFVDREGARGEIYSYGLRNPWRFSFDRRTGDLTIGDVGQGEVEEIDFVRRGDGAGANFGWRVWEGDERFAEGEEAPGHVEPVITRTHDQGWCSVTGGVVVRDPQLSALEGRYVFGDFCKGDILSAELARPRARDLSSTKLDVSQLSSFGEDGRGRVYATSLTGPVYRLEER